MAGLRGYLSNKAAGCQGLPAMVGCSCIACVNIQHADGLKSATFSTSYEATMKASKKLVEPADVLFRIKRGLSGYVSYLAACEMNEAFSEYVLYEPMLRILTARGFTVKCESPCHWVPKTSRGDYKKIDFEVTGKTIHFAIEVKWAKQPKLNVANDYEKLVGFQMEHPESSVFLCVFGRKTHVNNIVLNPSGFRERGEPIYADLKKTKFGCRFFEISRVLPTFKVKKN
jgi:hypothetical protein